MNHAFTSTAVKHFIANQPSIGVFGNRLNSSHEPIIHGTVHPHMQRLYDSVNNALGGSGGSGGSLHTGGNLHEPSDPKQMYHQILSMTPHNFEAIREMSAQMLGANPSPMWDKMAENETLEAPAEEYETVMKMPNQHAAARMLEADESNPTGGGFFKALKHITRKVGKIYKFGQAGINFVDRNKDALLSIPGLDNYKEGISGFLDTAKSIDAAVNPFVDAAIDATKENATPEDKQKLKKLATQSIDKAIETHLPGAKKYVEVAKDLNNTIQKAKRPAV
jgi:hypothetical protein